MFTVAPDGSGTHTDFQPVFTEANALGECSRVYIRVMPGEHRGQLVVPSKTSAPPITVYSTDPDASKTVIVDEQRDGHGGQHEHSATLTVKAIRGFQMKNITVSNDYVEGSVTGTRARWRCCCRAISRSSRTCASWATSGRST